MSDTETENLESNRAYWARIEADTARADMRPRDERIAHLPKCDSCGRPVRWHSAVALAEHTGGAL